MWTALFWKAAAERAVKTLAQTMLALWVVGDQLLNVFTVNWLDALGVGAGAMLVSVLMSLLSAGVGPADDPSLVAHASDGGRHEAE